MTLPRRWLSIAAIGLAPFDAAAISVSQIAVRVDGVLLDEAALKRLVNHARCACGSSVDVDLDFSGIDVTSDGEVALVVGDRCVDRDDRIDDGCSVLWRHAADTVSSRESITVAATDLADGGCTSSDGTEALIVLVDEDGSDRWRELSRVGFGAVTSNPPAPVSATLLAGEKAAEVRFEAGKDTPAGTRFQVLCADQAGKAVLNGSYEVIFESEEDLCGEVGSGGVRAAFVCSNAASGSPIRVTGLENGVIYEIQVVAVDEAGNPSAALAAGSVTPALEEDLWERYQRSGGLAEGGRACFVATAAYGDADDPQVRTLRAFRDRFLVTSAAGRWLVGAYYANSPPAAAWIRESDARRLGARVALAPLVWAAQALLRMEPSR